MLFEDSEYNFSVYDFSCSVDLNRNYSKRELCKDLGLLTERISNDLYMGKDIALHIRDCNGNVIYLPSYDHHPQKSLDRNVENIYNILFTKDNLRKQLEKVNIYEPTDITSIHFIYYLQILYFFYCMQCFIFPEIRYLDLFDRKNWSVENCEESNTGNDLYFDFIISNFEEVKEYKDILIHKKRVYDESWENFQSTFFQYYEIKRYDYLYELYEDQLQLADDEAFSKKLYEFDRLHLNQKDVCTFHQWFNDYNKYYEKQIVSAIEQHPIKEQSLFEDFLDFTSYCNAYALFNDSAFNFKNLDYLCLESLCNYAVNKISKVSNDPVYFDELPDILLDPDFIILCMQKDHLTATIKNNYLKKDPLDTIKHIWNFELSQLSYHSHDHPDFTFLKEDNDHHYYMTKQDIAIIVSTKIFMPYTLKYTTKKVLLFDRSDGQKEAARSIIRSFKAKKVEGFDLANSNFRDNIFRILCRVVCSAMNTGDMKEFLYFEVPVNTLIYDYFDKAERYRSIEQRTLYYQLFINIMNKETFRS